ncbi:MAG TPA: molybdopterin converting factor subunit 1 [Candidatus Saccharimonadia bacterium]|nr:molybdopterin converting factor subunit 1 [Candidatus Saccharimonadia bacterium]
MSVTVLYFASLRDRAGMDAETLPADGSVSDAYDALRARHDFAFARTQLRVAVNGTLASWDHALRDGDEIAFIPPVSGG